jgi:hypothetical protein
MIFGLSHFIELFFNHDDFIVSFVSCHYPLYMKKYNGNTFCLAADISECSSNPCQNGGRCTDQVNGYSCTCVAGYNGNRCQNSELLAMFCFVILSLLRSVIEVKVFKVKMS